jgi:hypothetical protein
VEADPVGEGGGHWLDAIASAEGQRRNAGILPLRLRSGSE